MPWTLYWYILRDLLKLLALATAVLVLVISAAVAIKPLSDGLLGPVALVKFILYTMPTTLQFALPFGAAFASTIVFNRMAADNEIVACSASGMSYLAILAPVVGLGLALTCGLFYLSGWVVPRFYERVEQLLRQDITHVLVSQVNRGQPVDEIPGCILYADAAKETEPPVLPDSVIQPTGRIVLSGVAVAKMERDGGMRNDATAEVADVLLFSGPQLQNQMWVTVRLRHVVEYDPVRDELIASADLPLEPVRIPSSVHEEPQFLDLGRLRAMGHDPDLYERVRGERARLASALAGEEIARVLEAALADPRAGPVELLGPGEERYRLRAPRVVRQGQRLVLEAAAQAPVRLEYLPGTRHVEARRAVVTIAATGLDPEPRLALELFEARIFDARSNRASDKPLLKLTNVRWPGLNMAGLARQPSSDLLKAAEQARYRDAKPVTAAAKELRLQIGTLIRKVIGQFHTRYASAVNCALVLLLGATLSLKLRGAMPLVVYFWSFLLTIIVVIIVQSGRTIVNRQQVSPGLLLLWAATLLLVMVIGAVYVRLARN